MVGPLEGVHIGADDGVVVPKAAGALLGTEGVDMFLRQFMRLFHVQGHDGFAEWALNGHKAQVGDEDHQLFLHHAGILI